jgi:acylaminoacyl-peptidase
MLKLGKAHADHGHVVAGDDGGALGRMYRAMARPGFEADRWRIVLMDVATGARREVAANWDRSADSLQWSADGRTLYVTAGDVGQTRLFSIDAARGTVVPVTGPGHVSAFDQTPSGFVYAMDSLTSPSELYVKTFRGREMARRITDVNPQLAARVFGEAEQFTFAGWNDETVHAYGIKPAGYVEGRGGRLAFAVLLGQGQANAWGWGPPLRERLYEMIAEGVR